MAGEEYFLILERVGIVYAAVSGGEGVEFAEHEEDVFEFVAVAWKVDEDIATSVKENTAMKVVSIIE